MYKNQVRRTDEHWRDNLIGLTLDKRLERAAMRKHGLESQLLRLEMQKGLIQKQIAGRRVELLPNIYEGAMCTATDKNRKILDVGFSTPEDLILDNFGKWLASWITPIATTVTASLKDLTNTARTLRVYGVIGTGVAMTIAYGSLMDCGTVLQVGSGSTAAARANYAIQTAFGTAPENTQFGCSVGSYGGGAISFSGAVTAGGSGTVNETGFFAVFNYGNSTPSYATFMLFHDILGSGVSFVAGNSLIVSYSITL